MNYWIIDWGFEGLIDISASLRIWFMNFVLLKEWYESHVSLSSSEHCSLSAVVSEAFVRFFVEIVGHYSLFMGGNERDEESSASSSSPTPLSFQRDAFRKAMSSKSLRRFLEVFMETQMFTAFIQEREMRRQGLRGTLGAHQALYSFPSS